MDLQNITTMISTTGFPIFAFLIAVYALKYAYDKSLEQTNIAMKEISDLTTAVNKNTETLAHLVEVMREK